MPLLLETQDSSSVFPICMHQETHARGWECGPGVEGGLGRLQVLGSTGRACSHETKVCQNLHLGLSSSITVVKKHEAFKPTRGWQPALVTILLLGHSTRHLATSRSRGFQPGLGNTVNQQRPRLKSKHKKRWGGSLVQRYWFQFPVQTVKQTKPKTEKLEVLITLNYNTTLHEYLQILYVSLNLEK